MIKTTVYLKTGEKIEFVDAEAKPVYNYVDGKFDSLTIVDKEGNHLGIFLDIAAVVNIPILNTTPKTVRSLYPTDINK